MKISSPPGLKNLVNNIISFVLIYFILDKLVFGGTIILEHFFQPILLNHSSLAPLYSGQINSEVLLVGSSHTQLEYDPRILSDRLHLSVYNLGRQGADLTEQSFLLEEYLLHNHKPQIVILEADMESLDDKSLFFLKSDFKPFQYFSFHTWNLFNNNPDELIRWPFLGISYARRFTNEIVEAKSRQSNFEYYQGAQLALKSQLDNEPIKINFNSISAQREAIYRRLLKRLVQENIEVFLVTSARYEPAQRNYYSPDYELTAKNFYKSLVNSQLKITYLDFSHEPEISQNPNYFFDNTHLNKNGAVVFSLKVANALQ